MNFNKEAYKLKMKPHIDKLVSQLQAKEIVFSEDEPGLENVVFKRKEKEVKISHHSFYGYSRICCVYKDRSDSANSVEILEVTDAMFVNNYIKPIIELHFINN